MAETKTNTRKSTSSKSSSPAVEAGIATDGKDQGLVTPEADHDRVVMASRHADGSPAQTDTFEYIGDKDTSLELTKTQLAQQKVSAVDVAKRGVTSGAGGSGDDVGSREPDPAVSELKEAHEKAEAEGHKDAEAEVDKHHHGLGD